LYQSPRKSRQSIYQDDDEFELPVQKRNRVLENLPMGIVGLMLILAFAFAGNIIGRNASAHNVAGEELASMMMAPTSSLSDKGSLPSASLLPEGETFATLNLGGLRRQTAIAKSQARQFRQNCRFGQRRENHSSLRQPQ